MIRVVRLIDHEVALAAAAESAAGRWTARRAWLLVVEDGDGHVGLGEAAPLPGYSRDTLEQAHAGLRSLFGRDFASETSASAALDVATSLGRASSSVVSPAARAALEAALLDLWARRAGVPAWQLLSAVTPPAALPVAAWLPDGAETALAAAEDAHARGVRTFKVKLDARRGLAHGIATLATLRRRFGSNVLLRADANRSATLAALEPELPTLRELGLEWLEEPTSEPLSKPLGVPVALDESLDATLPDLESHPDIVALVLKPTALGGIARCLELARHATAQGRACVASHALEGPVGFMAAATLALALPQRAAHGLGPYAGMPARSGLPALAPEREELVRWDAPGFGLSVEQALGLARIHSTERA